MELYENRVINGIVKSGVAVDPENARTKLSQDIQIITNPSRGELWPCIWALAAALERQFDGKIFIHCGVTGPLTMPAGLSDRVIFTTEIQNLSFVIGVGVEVSKFTENSSTCIWGDVVGAGISFGRLLPDGPPAHPVACFALAGYLAFAALGNIVGLPPNFDDYSQLELQMPFECSDSSQFLEHDFTVVGLGHLGQAFLALLFFLTSKNYQHHLVLIDKDRFELPNFNTQILLERNYEWVGQYKAEFLKQKFIQNGWKVTSETVDLNWEWVRPSSHPPLVLVGVDNFDTRKLIFQSGYTRVFEAGLGSEFTNPRITWHIRGCDQKEVDLFQNPEPVNDNKVMPQTDFEKKLYNDTPGQCGWFTFKQVQAAAPAMGLVAAAFVFSEILSYVQGERSAINGSARLWSPLLPFDRILN